MHDSLTGAVALLIIFLTVSIFSSVILNKVKFPYTIGLVIFGGLFGYLATVIPALSFIREIELTPSTILYIVLPILIFDASLNIDAVTLRKNIVPISILAIFGLLIATAVTGAGIYFAGVLSLGGAFLFGALISATDPVAVIALFKDLGAPKRLVTLIDGESIFNDATAIILFNIILSMVWGANGQAQNPHLGVAALKFLWVFFGGIAIGIAIGYVGSLIHLLDKGNIVFQITVTIVMAYLSFFVADHFFHVSGVMSTMATGIVLRLRSESVIKRNQIETVEHFWEFFAFVINSFIFLMLGLTEFELFQNFNNVKQMLFGFLISIPILLIARAACIYGTIPFYNYFTRKEPEKTIPSSFQKILIWGGLRGAVPVALILAIPHDLPERHQIINLTLGYILFTLFVQGTTIKKLMAILGVQADPSEFGNQKVATLEFEFKDNEFARLVQNRVVHEFDMEGFVIREKGEGEHTHYFLKKRVHAMELSVSEGMLIIKTPDSEEGYARTVVYETLLKLDQSIEHLKAVAQPAQLQKIITSTHQTTDQKHFEILKYISTDNIFVDIKANTKEECIKQLVENLKNSKNMSDSNLALQDVLEREKTMTTGLGEGIGLPHARTAAVTQITVALATHKTGIEFNSIDNKPVHLIALILSPKNDTGPHLQFLSALTREFSNPIVKEKLILSNSSEEYFQILKSAVTKTQVSKLS